MSGVVAVDREVERKIEPWVVLGWLLFRWSWRVVWGRR